MQTERTIAAVDALILVAIQVAREHALIRKAGNYHTPESIEALATAALEFEQAATADALAAWKTSKEPA